MNPVHTKSKTKYSADDRTSESLASEILKKAESGQARFFLQFGGQALSYINELQGLYDSGLLMEDYFQASFEALREEMTSERMKRPDFYPFSFDLKSWLDGSVPLPPAEYLQGAVISAPLIFITQVGHYVRFIKAGINQRELFAFSKGAVGHSQGISAALLIAQGLEGDEFLKAFKIMLKSLFWMGYRATETYPALPVEAALLEKSTEMGDPNPSPMASLKDIPRQELARLIEKVNSVLPEHRRLTIGLQNTPRTFIIVGARESLIRFRHELNTVAPQHKKNWSYLHVNIPFHSPYLKGAVAKMADDFRAIDLNLSGSQLKLPVFHITDGRNLQEVSDLNPVLAEVNMVMPLDWGRTVDSLVNDPEVTHGISFGPGNAVDAMTANFTRGKGIILQNVISPEKISGFLASTGTKGPAGKRWLEFSPRRTRLPDGGTAIVNEYVKFTGHPPFLGGGMTPTTVEVDIVAAAANRGYVVEWAGGGQVTEGILIDRLRRLMQKINPGEGIVFNMLYLDAYLWNMQFPLIRKLRQQGYPIDGVTISAGVPDTKEALQILEDLEQAGIWMNSFKPGTTRQIRQVIEIAAARPEKKIIMQVEGGAAGGHHSWENLENLILEDYHRIRERENIILAVGGGIFEPAQAYAWLSGEWNPENPMPVDAVILGTRLMAAREACTAGSIKKWLRDLTGGPDWKSTDNGKSVGGVISGKSGLGATIYYAENRWSRLSAWLDELLKGKKSEDVGQIIELHRQEIIKRVNQTAKPYFGEPENMTYAGLLDRFVALTCPGERLRSVEGDWPDQPFIDISYRRRLFELIHAFENRLSPGDRSGEPSLLQREGQLDRPEEFLEMFYGKHPGAIKLPLLPEDVELFYEVCSRPGKPVNFIPIIDENIVKWLRADSLWYSHCIDIDPESCAFIPGPVAVGGIRDINEPVAEILNSFERYTLERLAHRDREDGHSTSTIIPDRNLPRHRAESSEFPSGILNQPETDGGILEIRALPDLTDEQWLDILAGLGTGPLTRALQSRIVFEDRSPLRSPLIALLRPLLGRKYRWSVDAAGNLAEISVFSERGREATLRLDGLAGKETKAQLSLYFRRPETVSEEEILEYRHEFTITENIRAPLTSDPRKTEEAVLDFYREIWCLKNPDDRITLQSEFKGEFVLDAREIEKFRAAVLDLKHSDFSIEGRAEFPPLSMAVATGWHSLMSGLLAPEARGNIFRLLHLKHDYEWSDGGWTGLQSGMTLGSRARITGVRTDDRGKEIRVGGSLFLKSAPDETLCQFRSTFLIRGNFGDESLLFYEIDPGSQTIQITSEAQKFFLNEHPGIRLRVEEVRVGDLLEFRPLHSKDLRRRNGEAEFYYHADILCAGSKVGEFELSARDEDVFNEPLERLFLALERIPTEKPLARRYLHTSEIVRTPEKMDAYSAASLDCNPIHTDNNFAGLAGLQTPIVHGMWTAAQALRIAVERPGSSNPGRLFRFRSRFEYPVLPGEKLIYNFFHRGMEAGCSVFDIEAENSSGVRVYSGETVIRPPRTAYIFTGQGSQSQGMGMKFYDKYPEARQIWERAERVTTDSFGFSLLGVVRENPERLRVAGVDYRHPRGVLNLTQFTQVGLTVKALADWAVLKNTGMLVDDAPFAGHSLGEYAALACQEVLELESVLRIVYYRGLTMQKLVPRDSESRSPFGMSAILGNRHVGLNEERIREMVRQIREETGLHLEVVNYNIRDRQYSVTGYLEALELLENRLSEMARGHRTFIRLAGIDVPFHSSLLIPGVEAFRDVLRDNLGEDIDYDILENRYIPNLIAEPYESSESFIQKVADQSDSPVLGEILQKGINSRNRKTVQRALFIELLAYQFANPVQWIKTQDLLLQHFKVERLIDIGARGDLADMARQTLKSYNDLEKPQVLHIEENSGQVFFELEDATRATLDRPDDGMADQGESPKGKEGRTTVRKGPEVPSTGTPESSAPAPIAPATSATARPVSDAEPVPDLPLDRMDALKAVLSLKAGIRPDEIGDQDSIENIFSGNSSKRNQALADLGSEFSSNALEGGHEKPLTDLVTALEKQSPYKSPGPFLRTAFTEFIKSFMPPGFGRNEIFKHLAEERLLPESHVFAVCNMLPLVARSDKSTGSGDLSPIGLSQRPASAREAREWLDRAVDLYGEHKGLRVPYRSRMGTAASAAVAVDAGALEELEGKYFGLDGAFYRILNYSRLALNGQDPFARFLQADREIIEDARSADSFRREHGEAYDRVATPQFDPAKLVDFDNCLPWARKNLFRSFWNVINDRDGEIPAVVVRQVLGNAMPGMQAMVRYLAEIAGDFQKKELQSQLESIGRSISENSGADPVFIPTRGPAVCSLEITDSGLLDYTEKESTPANLDRFIQDLRITARDGEKRQSEILESRDGGNSFESSGRLNTIFNNHLQEVIKNGAGFSGKTALVTGAGENSIAIEAVKNFLSGGMQVVLTTSSYSDRKIDYYKKIYQDYATGGASLLLAPFSQGSGEDIRALVSHMFESGMEPDLLMPFGAVGEENSLLSMGAESLASLRVMLLGVHQLIGEFANQYARKYIHHKKFTVLLPLSPNHGIFGRDGMYAETKLGLEALFRKWYSEHQEWGRFCRLLGCRIGWVRGTGLMELNNVTAPALESECGLKTFSQPEMALLLTALTDLSFQNAELPEVQLADLSGGLDRVADLSVRSAGIRNRLLEEAKKKKELHGLREKLASSPADDDARELHLISPTTSPDLMYPELPTKEDLKRLNAPAHLSPDRLICVVGFGEVSPGGTSATRWEMEKDGRLSVEGAVELAWTTGRIRYRRSGSGACWVDASTEQEISDWEVKEKFEEEMLAASGIRVINPEHQSFDPEKSPVYTDVLLEEDFYIPAADETEARQFKAALPDSTDIYYNSEKDSWFVRRKKGSTIKVLKAVKLNRFVGGQIPDGWDPAIYGIPGDLIRQIDRITMYNIVATCEAFIRAGMEPFELYRYLHPGQVGTTTGSGMGGMIKLRQIFQDHLVDRQRQHDALQESLINVSAAWAITSLIGSAGPIQTPVSACATGGISLDMGVNLIREGKARFIVAGAYDDLCEDGVIGFADMNATANADEMMARGISPSRMCRPNDSRRGGFLESQGGGALLLARGDLVLEMGLPVYGIIGYSASHSEGIQASIPAPGQGLVVSAAEKGEHPLADGKLREKLLAAVDGISLGAELASQEEEIKKLIRVYLGHDYWIDDSRISPLRGALSVFNLRGDDIAFVYKHDTSTRANDPNENRLHNEIQAMLGRDEGNPLLVVSQKSLTGHSKGGAACWQINGMLQCMNSGLIPGNRNLENVDPTMNSYHYMCFTDETIHVGPHRIRAGLLTTLGFGHVGALCLLIHPDYFFGSLDESQREEYLERRERRNVYCRNRFHEIRMEGREPLYRRRLKGPYQNEDEEIRVYLNPLARINAELKAFETETGPS